MSTRTPRWTLLAFGAALVLAMDGCGGDHCFSPPRCGGAGCTGSRSSEPILHVRRLSRAEYANSIEEAFGITPDESSLPEEDTERTTASPAGLLEIEAYRTIAESTADAVADHAHRLCEQDDDDCWRGLIESWSTRLLRRPPSEADWRDISEVCSAGKQEGGMDEGVRRSVAFLLQLPEFIYLVERGSNPEDGDGSRRLGDWELAGRMALALWNGPPDDGLLAAARRGELQDSDARVAQASRMLSDPRATAMVVETLSSWLAADLIYTTKSEEVYPGFGTWVLAAQSQTEAFIGTVFEEHGGLADFLTEPRVPINRALAELYDIDPAFDGSEWLWVEPSQPRFGLLTLPGFLAAKAHPDGSSPISRGLFVTSNLLCRAIPPPPPGLDIGIPVPRRDETTRDSHERHRSDPTCAGCHEHMDPIGFAFEHYDGIGRYRATDNGIDIDASGAIRADGEHYEFEDLGELVRRLADSDDVRSCWSSLWITTLTPGISARRVEETAEMIAQSEVRSLKDLLIRIVSSDEFATVRPPDE